MGDHSTSVNHQMVVAGIVSGVILGIDIMNTYVFVVDLRENDLRDG